MRRDGEAKPEAQRWRVWPEPHGYPGGLDSAISALEDRVAGHPWPYAEPEPSYRPRRDRP